LRHAIDRTGGDFDQRHKGRNGILIQSVDRSAMDALRQGHVGQLDA
jgi:hypothetical protein